MRVCFLFVMWLAVWLAIVAVAYGGEPIPFPADDRDPLVGYSGLIRSAPQGRLLSREVYDLNGRRIAIEEYTDATPQRATPTKAASKCKCESNPCSDGKCNAYGGGGDCECETRSSQRTAPPKAKSAATETRAEAPTYKLIGGYWYQGVGNEWVLLPATAAVTARSVPQSPFVVTRAIPARRAIGINSSLSAGFQVGNMSIGAGIAGQVGNTSG